MTPTEYIAQSNNSLAALYRNNPKAPRFKAPERGDSVVVERMMRMGIEARALKIESEDMLFEVAVASLRNDHVRHHS